jgi:hypothetical protein
MDAGIYNIIYIELHLGPKMANGTCGKTIVVGTIERGSTVLILQVCAGKCMCTYTYTAENKQLWLKFRTSASVYHQHRVTSQKTCKNCSVTVHLCSSLMSAVVGSAFFVCNVTVSLLFFYYCCEVLL